MLPLYYHDQIPSRPFRSTSAGRGVRARSRGRSRGRGGRWVAWWVGGCGGWELRRARCRSLPRVGERDLRMEGWWGDLHTDGGGFVNFAWFDFEILLLYET